MTTFIEPKTSKRRTQPARNGNWEKAGSLLRLVVVLTSLGAFLLSQLVVNQGVEQQTPDILVVKQIDAEEAKLKEEGNSDTEIGVVLGAILLPCFSEQWPVFEAHSGFQFERLLCLGSRGPPKG
jgi:hypothetical protein